MNKYDELLKWIESGANSLIVAMLAIMYYMIQADGMTAANLSDIMSRISMSYDTSINTLTSGGTTYTIYQLFSHVITNIYPNSLVVTPEFIKMSIYKAKRLSYITLEQYTTLFEALANA